MSRKPDPDAIWDCRNPESVPSLQLAKARFCFIPGAAATDNRLKLQHWRFLAYVGRQNADHGWLRISQTKLAEQWGCNRSTLNTSIRVEEKLAAVQRHNGWNSQDENAAYQKCLADVLQEDEGRTWAEGNIRVGDYILLIDSDTRVPKDCLLDGVSEMEQSPEVAIMQYQSGVMNVTGSFFENG